ncbi:MAG TPA: TetR/AcrR family transcriptional regulator [Candidatus Binataceae bacterium]|nr:TetR/AcrR family transcriptional regulator [Candidatus Binataceae bacterium]
MKAGRDKVSSERGRPRFTSRGSSKRKRILDAAAKVLARRGYSGAQMSEIAEEAGTLAGSLYYHFKSREDLIEQVLREGVTSAFARTREIVEALPAAASARERLEAAIRAHLKFQLVESDYARGAVRSMGHYPDDMWARTNSQFRSYGRFFDSLIGAAQKARQIDPEINRSALRMLILGAANWAPEWYRSGGTLSAEEIADLLVRMVFHGVGNSDSGKLSTSYGIKN